MRTTRSRRSKHQIMANQGFGPVKIIQVGEKRLTELQLNKITIADAFKSLERGLAITSA